MKNISVFTRLSAALLCLSMLLPLAACGAKSADRYGNSSSSFSAQAETAPAPTPAAPPKLNMMNSANAKPDGNAADSSVASPPLSTQRKLIKNAQVVLESKEFDTALPQLIAMIENAGGYIEGQNIDGKSIRNESEYYERTARLVARIPADKLSTITSEMGTLCNITSSSESIDDITDRYFDADAHLKMLKTQQTRLLELLAKAETLENIIQLEEALNNCEYEIESLTGQLRRMDSQVSYSTLNLTVNEVVDYNVPQSKPKNFAERLGDAFTRSGKNIVNTAEDVLFFLIIDGPVLAIYLLFFAAIFYIAWRIVRRGRAKRAAKPLPATLDSSEINRPSDDSK